MDILYNIVIMYLYIIIGYLINLLSCDFQKILKNNVFAQHIAAAIALFFLVVLVNADKKESLSTVLFNTMVVYSLFVISSKAKFIFVISAMFILIIDLSIKTHIIYVNENNPEQDVSKFENMRSICKLLFFITIFAGFAHYIFRAALIDHKDDFSIYKFLLGTPTCKF